MWYDNILCARLAHCGSFCVLAGRCGIALWLDRQRLLRGWPVTRWLALFPCGLAWLRLRCRFSLGGWRVGQVYGWLALDLDGWLADELPARVRVLLLASRPACVQMAG